MSFEGEKVDEFPKKPKAVDFLDPLGALFWNVEWDPTWSHLIPQVFFVKQSGGVGFPPKNGASKEIFPTTLCWNRVLLVCC